jgi:hypothetical protein
MVIYKLLGEIHLSLLLTIQDTTRNRVKSDVSILMKICLLMLYLLVVNVPFSVKDSEHDPEAHLPRSTEIELMEGKGGLMMSMCNPWSPCIVC